MVNKQTFSVDEQMLTVHTQALMDNYHTRSHGGEPAIHVQYPGITLWQMENPPFTAGSSIKTHDF